MNGRWEAQIRLLCEKRHGRNVMTDCAHIGPLMVQKVFYPEDIAHIYLLHPPGGIAGCDELKVELEVGAEAQALLTTPGSTKFYRTQGDQVSRVTQRYIVGENASLEILPQPSIYFKGTHTRVFNEIHAGPGGRFFFRDITVCGSLAQGDGFENSYIFNAISVYRSQNKQALSLEDEQAKVPYPLIQEKNPKPDQCVKPGLQDEPSIDTGERVSPMGPKTERLQLREALRVDGMRDLDSIPGLATKQCAGTVLACPADEADLEQVRTICAECKEVLSGATLIEDLLVIRMASARNELLEQLVVEIWKRLRPSIIGARPVVPRVWAT